MANDRTRLIVRKTCEQLRAEWLAQGDGCPYSPLTLDAFEARLDFNLDLAGVAKVSGRKPGAKQIKVTSTRPD